ncbi:hypothetical protein NQ317_007011 [Molorchus minor]|uniref:Serpin domain-containing protein n=1 Tax=Molorchus minor TaxID=1323400 RepID=A0ABQ9JW34_9CUCU|nr:hypothetical protein NQ317_007011 [Molorchus minor]
MKEFSGAPEFSTKYRNVLLSPISIKLILALLYQGSSGATEREFKTVLRYSDRKTVDEDYKQIISTLQIEPNQNFQRKANQIYRTEIRPTDFSHKQIASTDINSWIERLTNGKLAQLVTPGDLEQTVMLIANAVYFKGTWRHQFPKNQTHRDTFVVSSNDMTNMKTVIIPYMSTIDQFFIKESVELDAKILRLPYKGSDYSMFILLPNSLGGLPNLIRRINLNTLSSLLYSLEKRTVVVNIPKFKFNFKAKMAEVLKQFGLREMFQNTASFTGLVKGNSSLIPMLVVSDIVQKSGIELDEEGSVVYSATDVNIGNKFGEPKDVFNATHPFLFFIEGPNGTILFNGKVENPLEEGGLSTENRYGNGIVPPANVQTEANLYPQNFKTPGDQNAGAARPSGLGSPQIQGVSNLQPEKPNLVPINLEPNNYEFGPNADKEELLYRFNLFDVDIKTTLAMILEGAGGNSAMELSEALRIPNIDHRIVREILMGFLNTLRSNSGSTYLENSNAIFPSDKYRVVEKYRRTIEDFYRGYINTVNFRNVNNAVNTINNWVSNATHSAIKEIVGPSSITTETSVVITNALYFRGKWKTSFDPDDTKAKCFQTRNGCVLTPMMRVSSNFNYSYISKLRAHAIDIPYENDFSMLILLPAEDASIRNIIRDLIHFKLGDILDKLRTSDMILQIPRFEIDYSTDLVGYLKQLRIREIFGNKANMSGIVENGNVLINSLLHKTHIEVDEQGTVAAAATGAVVIPLIGSTSIVVDRPFVFCIYHQTTANILFEGILLNPQEQGSTGTTARTFNNPNFRFRSRAFQ